LQSGDTVIEASCDLVGGQPFGSGKDALIVPSISRRYDEAVEKLDNVSLQGGLFLRVQSGELRSSGTDILPDAGASDRLPAINSIRQRLLLVGD
jgi:hypothetical protein